MTTKIIILHATSSGKKIDLSVLKRKKKSWKNVNLEKSNPNPLPTYSLSKSENKIKWLKSNYGPVKLLDEGHRLSFQTPLKQYKSDPFDFFTFSYILLKLNVFIGIRVDKSIQINSSEAELLERSLLRLSHLCHSHIGLNVHLKQTRIEREREELVLGFA